MQNETLRRFGKDLQDAFVMPVSFLSKKTKKKSTPAGSQAQQHSNATAPPFDYNSSKGGGFNGGMMANMMMSASKDTSDTCSLSNFYSSDHGGQASHATLRGHDDVSTTSVVPSSRGFFQSLRSNNSSNSSNGGGGSTVMLSQKPAISDQPALVHCPPSVASLDQFSPKRLEWIRGCISQTPQHQHHHQQQQQHHHPNHQNTVNLAHLSPLSPLSVASTTWDQRSANRGGTGGGASGDDSQSCAASLVGLDEHGSSESRVGRSNRNRPQFNNPNESLGLLLVKIISVTNRASSKPFDAEWSLRVNNVERMSHPARSFKDSPGSTATMNEVFLFDVNEPFQLEVAVNATPVASKFGTMAGLPSMQSVSYGQLSLSFALEPMEKSVRTYKLRRPVTDCDHSQGGDYQSGTQVSTSTTTTTTTKSRSSNNNKADCEVIMMVGIHLLDDPVEDKNWESERIYEGTLTIMTRGGRMPAWKRYWAVLEGRQLKLYDAEYQEKKDPIGLVSLRQVCAVQPPDYDKVDVGGNGFSLVLRSEGIDLQSWPPKSMIQSRAGSMFEGSENQYSVPQSPAEMDQIDPKTLDYCIYAFTDSAQLLDQWQQHLTEALDQYQECMQVRHEIEKVKVQRRASRISMDTHSMMSSGSNGSHGQQQQQQQQRTEFWHPSFGGDSSELVDLKFVW